MTKDRAEAVATLAQPPACAAPAAPAGGHPRTPKERFELLRALGMFCAAPTDDAPALSAALGLAPLSAEEHTRVFVLALAPFAAICLGPEGMLGGVAADRIAGFWRALALSPPPEPDHLGALLDLYAHLGEAAESCATEAARERLAHARRVLFSEHLASWAGPYLAAVEADGTAAPWAALLRRALMAERALDATPLGERLPRALAEAPGPLAADVARNELLDALVAPIRSGFVLTYADLEVLARNNGAGLRRGERRFALRSLLEQIPTETLAALARHAERSVGRHVQDRRLSGNATATWWARRARHSATLLGGLARDRAPAG